MGYYTGLRVHIIVKEEFDPVINKLMDPHDGIPWEDLTWDQRNESDWRIVADAFPQYPFLADWAEVGRCDFIPRGAIAMHWREEDPDWGERLYKDREWKFQCSLKNYEGETE